MGKSKSNSLSSLLAIHWHFQEFKTGLLYARSDPERGFSAWAQMELITNIMQHRILHYHIMRCWEIIHFKVFKINYVIC